jgi:hypothetical protein
MNPDGTIWGRLTNIPEAELAPAENKVNVLDLPPPLQGTAFDIPVLADELSKLVSLKQKLLKEKEKLNTPETVPTIPKATPASDKSSVESSESTKPLQSHVAARFDCIDPVVLKLLAECLGFGAAKYYPYSYHRIPVDDHINHALNHINEHRRLSQETRIDSADEMHLVNALARITFALSCLAQQGKYPTTYSHPEQNHATPSNP